MLLNILSSVLNRRQYGPTRARWWREKTCVCPICEHQAHILDAVDFNKSCEGEKVSLPHAGHSVEYFYCPSCGFCFAPGMYIWSIEDFKSKVYNADYALIDPEYVELRPTRFADMIDQLFGAQKNRLAHLDYGGGNGRLSEVLRERGWRTLSYDPLIDASVGVHSLGRFELVTVFEVFEHVPDMHALMANLDAVLAPNGLIFLSTLLSDHAINPHGPLDWWYAAPRNGHVSLYSTLSLDMLFGQHGFKWRSLTPDKHVAYRAWPDWASAIA